MKDFKKGWIAVDLDGTLAHYDEFRGADHIGEPIAPMINRVKQWLAEGRDVRIFTARVDGGIEADKQGEPGAEQFRNPNTIRTIIQDWCELHIGQRVPVTNVKDYGMIELWDDRAVRVVKNTGEMCCGRPTQTWTP